MKKALCINVNIDAVSNVITPISKSDQIQFDMYMKGMKPGVDYQIIITLQDDARTVRQLAKIHALIRDIADFSGMTFSEVKEYVKRESSLYQYNGDETSLKSFTLCSKKELDTAINVANMFAASIGCLPTV